MGIFWNNTINLIITYLAPLTRARAPVSGLPLCLYISLHQKNRYAAVHLFVVLNVLSCS